MLYNKNNVRKTNDKKILHKVGKQWKVVSVALLMAIGGGAAVAATNNNANAQSTNGASVSVQSEAANLENDHYTPASATSSKASSASASAKAPSLANVNYAPSARVNGANASAASYNNQDDFDKAEINFYGPTVKSYVNSINAKFPAEARNLQSNANSASVATVNYAKSANNYSNVAKNSANSSVVSSLASNTGLTASAFIDNVKYQASNYTASVKSASDDANAMNLAYSLAGFASSVATNDNLPEMVAEAHVSDVFNRDNYVAAADIIGATSTAYQNALNASEANADALTNATVDSINASGAAHIALANSAADARAVNSVAQSLSNNGDNFNSSAVSSEVSFYARNYAPNTAYTFATQFSASSNNASSGGNVVTLSADNTPSLATNTKDEAENNANARTNALHASENAAYTAMSQVVSDTAAMNSAYTARSNDNSVIASAKAAKANYASDVTSTSLSAKNASNGLSNLAAKADAAHVAYEVLSNGSDGIRNYGLADYANLLENEATSTNALHTLAHQFGLAGNNDAKGIETLAAASGVDVNTLKNNESAIKSMVSDVATGARSAMNGKDNNTVNAVSALSSAMSSQNSVVVSAYNNAVSASASYARATDEDVTLASYYASSYSDDAKSEASVASDAAKDLNNFYLANADAKFASADEAYTTAKNAEPNDHTLAHAFGVFVLHNSPQFITVTKNAMLHSAANYTAKNGVKSVKAGESFAVKGVAFDEAGNIRYVVGESDNNPVYLTGNDSYVENTYLEPEGEFTVRFNKSANAHKGLNFNSKVVGSVKAGQTVTGNAVATLANNTYNLYEGVARLQLKDGSYVTANQNYFTVLNNNANDNNDNSESNKANNNYVRDLVLFK